MTFGRQKWDMAQGAMAAFFRCLVVSINIFKQLCGMEGKSHDSMSLGICCVFAVFIIVFLSFPHFFIPWIYRFQTKNSRGVLEHRCVRIWNSEVLEVWETYRRLGELFSFKLHVPGGDRKKMKKSQVHTDDHLIINVYKCIFVYFLCLF